MTWLTLQQRAGLARAVARRSQGQVSLPDVRLTRAEAIALWQDLVATIAVPGGRLLTPRELARGQDFPEDYIIDRGHDGRKFSVATQVRMIGNSVNPVMAEAFLRANAPWLAVKKAA